MPVMEQKLYLGVDPGKAGGAAVLQEDGVVSSTPAFGLLVIKFDGKTEHEIAQWFRYVSTLGNCWGALEKVRSSPQMGVVSAFTFGWGYGGLRMALAMSEIPFVEPTPQQWQKAMSCMSKGDKNVTKRKAHERWPALADKITHAIADAMLIAEWLRTKGK